MKGTISRFFRNRGYGFIKPKDGGKNVLVHWSDVVTDDKWPFVRKGTVVEFELVDKDANGNRSARMVTLADGEKIPVFIPKYKDRVLNKKDIFKGTVDFYDLRKGFGMIKPDKEISWQKVTTDQGVFFARDAIVFSGRAKGLVLNLRRGTKVSFKIYKSKKGLGAHELQDENGSPLQYVARERRNGKKRTRVTNGDGKKKPLKKAKVVKKTRKELLEEREIDEYEKIYTGTVKLWRAAKDFGIISINEDITFEGETAKQKIIVMKDDIICFSDEVGLNGGVEVMFKVYKDSMGLGAYDVHNEDGTPVIYEPKDAEAEN